VKRDLPTRGAHSRMPAAEYHSLPAFSASGLKLMRKSPAHYYGAMLDPNRPPDDPSDAMRLGTLFHTALFEPAEVAARYVVKPEGLDGRTKEGKAWLSEQTGREVIAADKMRAALAMAASARALPEVESLLGAGDGEVSAFWTDEETGELCKCRPDWVFPVVIGSGVILVDGKSCQDASPAGFSRAIWNYCYHLQAAWYSDGYERATGKRVHGFVFVAVESAWPHAAAPYMLCDDVLDRARVENRLLLNRYAECKRTGNWPGYSRQISLINLPAWAQQETAA